MAMLRRWRFGPREVTHSYDGNRFTIWLPDANAADWYDCDWEDLAELSILKQHRLKPGARVFDLGAHHGVLGMMLARCVGDSGQTVVVEADPFCVSVAERNRQTNQVENMKIVAAAITESSGVLSAPDGSPSGEAVHRFLDWGDQGVRAMSLDDVTNEHGVPDVVMIDVDGFDCHALRGGQKTLAAKPDFFVEVHVGAGLEKEGGSKEEVLSFFPETEWNRLVAGQKEHVFRPYQPDLELLNERFFLIATPK